MTAKAAKTAGKSPAPMLKLKLVRSLIGSTDRQRATVRALGLRRLNHAVERQDTREIRGMVEKVAHLLEVTEG